MKIYSCKKCGFRGSRKQVRRHLRTDHWVRGLKKDMSGERLASSITPQMKSEEWK